MCCCFLAKQLSFTQLGGNKSQKLSVYAKCIPSSHTDPLILLAFHRHCFFIRWGRKTRFHGNYAPGQSISMRTSLSTQLQSFSSETEVIKVCSSYWDISSIGNSVSLAMLLKRKRADGKPLTVTSCQCSWTKNTFGYHDVCTLSQRQQACLMCSRCIFTLWPQYIGDES